MSLKRKSKIEDSYEVDPVTGCWNYLGCIRADGYASRRDGTKGTLAHIIMYKKYKGAVPSHLELHQKCDNRKCINPEHLVPVAELERQKIYVTIGALNRSKTQCPYGHEFSFENTYITPRGRRDCKICQRKRVIEYRARKKAQKGFFIFPKTKGATP
jgi:hypothetical protein